MEQTSLLPSSRLSPSHYQLSRSVSQDPSLIRDAQNVTVNGGTFYVGCAVNVQEAQHQILSVLERVPNYRDIHSANLGRATKGTGPQFDEGTDYHRWMMGELKEMWGTGMREPALHLWLTCKLIFAFERALGRPSSRKFLS